MPHLDAPLGLPICLWLELAGLFLLVPWVMGLAGTNRPGAQGPGGLSWAVHLDSLEDGGPEETLEQQADALARAAGLLNAGRIGELRGYYLLVQPVGQQQGQPAEAVRRQAEAVLAGHEAVRWHSEQRLLKRAKRSVHFNDPKYPQQWHLVSPALPPAALRQRSWGALFSKGPLTLLLSRCPCPLPENMFHFCWLRWRVLPSGSSFPVLASGEPEVGVWVLGRGCPGSDPAPPLTWRL